MPAATVPVHELTPSLTVILPVGVPLTEVTLKLTTMACPTTDGSGLSEMMVVVVLFFKKKTFRTDSTTEPEPLFCPVA